MQRSLPRWREVSDSPIETEKERRWERRWELRSERERERREKVKTFSLCVLCWFVCWEWNEGEKEKRVWESIESESERAYSVSLFSLSTNSSGLRWLLFALPLSLPFLFLHFSLSISLFIYGIWTYGVLLCTVLNYLITGFGN